MPGPDSREARIEAEAVTDAEIDAAMAAFNVSDRVPILDPRDKIDRAAFRSALEAARKARASNPPAAEGDCVFCGKPIHQVVRKGVEVWFHADGIRRCNDSITHATPRAPQPAPDRVSRIEAALDTLFAGVTGLREDWDRALIAAAKAWNREGE